MEGFIGNLGVALALAGALLTAIPEPRIASYGFAAYVCADLPLFIYTVLIGAKALAVMYAGFVLLAALGIYLRSRHGARLYQRASMLLRRSPSRPGD